jgi:hypothetical protein
VMLRVHHCLRLYHLPALVLIMFTECHPAQGHMEHASSNGGMMTPNGHHIISPFTPFPGQGAAYHLAVPALHAELMRYPPHLPAGAGHFGFPCPSVSMVNGHIYPSQPMMYPMSFPGAQSLCLDTPLWPLERFCEISSPLQ